MILRWLIGKEDDTITEKDKEILRLHDLLNKERKANTLRIIDLERKLATLIDLISWCQEKMGEAIDIARRTDERTQTKNPTNAGTGE